MLFYMWSLWFTIYFFSCAPPVARMGQYNWTRKLFECESRSRRRSDKSCSMGAWTLLFRIIRYRRRTDGIDLLLRSSMLEENERKATAIGEKGYAFVPAVGARERDVGVPVTTGRFGANANRYEANERVQPISNTPSPFLRTRWQSSRRVASFV